MCLILVWGVAGWLQAQTVPAQTPTAGNFKTLYGKEYKDATVSRVEPDGVVLRTKSGISKVYFVELPKEVQERFHYDAANAAQFTAASQEAVGQLNEVLAAQQQQEAQERQRQAAAMAQQWQQAEEQQRQAEAIALQQQQQQAQAEQRHARQQQQRPRPISSGAVASQRAQEDQRIDRENGRNLENMQRDSERSRLASQREWQQMQWVQQNRVENARQQLQLD
jgi:hypothetical protein